jgi:riboflavin biosynthesis pyrimidine reductase
VRRLLPNPTDAELSDADLLAAYAVPAGPGPHVRANFVASADGAVSLDGVSGGLSAPADKRIFGLLRDLADVVLVGAGTVRAENYGYPAHGDERRARRRDLGLAELPRLAVVSGSLNLDPTSRFFTDALVPPFVLTTAAAGRGTLARDTLGEVAEIVAAGAVSLDLRAAVALLAERGLRRILCEGGAALLGELTAADVLDELCLTLSPLLVGAGPGRISGGPPHPPRAMTLRHVLADDGMLFARYAVERAG